MIAQKNDLIEVVMERLQYLPREDVPVFCDKNWGVVILMFAAD